MEDAPRAVLFPCGVVKLVGFLGPELRQQLFDNTVIAGWDHHTSGRENERVARPDDWYTGTRGAPDIILHYNYYSEPARNQPPPLAILRIADQA